MIMDENKMQFDSLVNEDGEQDDEKDHSLSGSLCSLQFSSSATPMIKNSNSLMNIKQDIALCVENAIHASVNPIIQQMVFFIHIFSFSYLFYFFDLNI